MYSLIWLVLKVIDIYVFFVIAGVIMSWLVAFGVLNTSNRFVYLVYDALFRITEPALRPIRRFMPGLGGIDLSPLVLLLLLFFLQRLIVEMAYGAR